MSCSPSGTYLEARGTSCDLREQRREHYTSEREKKLGPERTIHLPRVTQHGDRNNALNPSSCSVSQTTSWLTWYPKAVKLAQGSNLPSLNLPGFG